MATSSLAAAAAAAGKEEEEEEKVTSPTSPLLDHIVILVPHAFLASPPSWFADAFTLYPGGQHADGVTENVLVFFADGSYLELIAFVDDDVGRGGRAGHRWGEQKEGKVIDWALTLFAATNDDDDEGTGGGGAGGGGGLESVSAAFREVQRKVRDANGEGGAGIEYRDLVRGGRNRPDGAVLKWAISTADARGNPLEPGVLPFWCLDETPRELRVPYKETDKDGRQLAEHASGAVGVALLQVVVAGPQTSGVDNDTSSSSGLRPVYDVLFSPRRSDSDDGRWAVSAPEAGHHPHGEVRLRTTTGHDDGKEGEKLAIKFFTTSPEFAGKKIGGHITDQVQLEFEFVSTG